MQQHRIDQVIFDIDTGRGEAAPLQQRVSEFCRTGLELVLERALADCGPQGALSFVRLELDLGQIPAGQLEGLLAERIGHRLRDLLARHIAGQVTPVAVEAEVQPAWHDAADAKPVPQAAAVARTIPAQPGAPDAGDDHDGLDTLAELLQRGRYPTATTFDAGRLLMRLSADTPEALIAMLRRVGMQAAARKRLASQFADPVLERIVHLLEPAHAALVITCAREIGTIHRQTPVAPQDARGLQRAVWEFILVYLLIERGSRFNTRAFTASLLRQMAGRYRIAYADLLAMLIGSVGQVALPFSARSSLPVLLMDLQNQIAAPAVDAETQLSHAARRLRDAAAFLEFGAFDGVPRQPGQDGNTLVAELLQQQPDAMRLLLRTLGPRAAVRLRLAGQLDEPVLVSLVQVIEPVHAGAMVSHMRGMRRMHANQQLVPQDAAGFGRVLWQLVLDYLLAERGSLFNRRSYVHSLLLGMAARYRMRYSDLLAAVLSHLSVRASPTVRADSLAGILLSLSDQAWLGPTEDTAPATTPVLTRLLDDSGAAALASRLDGMDDAAIAPLLRQIGSDSGWWTHAAAKLPPRLVTRLLAIAGKRLGSFASDARDALHMLLAPHVGGGAATSATVAGYLLAALLQPVGQGALPAGRPRAVQLLRSMLSAACARFGLSYRAQLTRLAEHPVHGTLWRNACNILLEELETLTPTGRLSADANAPTGLPGTDAASAKTAAPNQVEHDASPSGPAVRPPADSAEPLPVAPAGSAHTDVADAAALALYYVRHGALPASQGGASRPDLRALLRDPNRAAALLSTADLRPDMIRRLLAHAPRAHLLALLAALYPGAIAMLTAFLDGCAALAQAGIGAGSGLRRTEAEALHWQLLLETLLDRHAPRLPVAELLAELGAQASRRLGVTRADYGLAWEAALATRPAAPQAAAVLAQALGRIAGDAPTENGIHQATAAVVRNTAWPLLSLMPEQGATGLTALQAYLQFGTLPMERRSRGKAAQLQVHFAAALQAQPADLKQMLLQASGNAVQRAQLASHTPRALQQAALQLLLGDAYAHSIRAMNVLLQLPNAPWHAAELISLLLAAIHRRGGRRLDPGLFLLDVLRSRPDLPETTAALALQQLRGAFAGRQDGGWRRHIDHVERSKATPRHYPAPEAAPSAAAQAWRFPEPAAELPTGAVYYIANAGMVLLWPFLQQYFNGLSMLDGRAFRSPQEQSRAVHLLQYLATGSAAANESELMLNKLLCGMPGAAALEADAVADAVNIGDAAIGLSEQLLTGVTQNWPKLKNTSIRVLRESFLMREGRLNQREDGWVLNVSSGPFDPLLQSLPWGLAVVRLPWMSHALWVEWKR